MVGLLAMSPAAGASTTPSQRRPRPPGRPAASCTSTTSLAAFWVGIDGYSSGSVEQDGTLVECYRDVAYYYTWWEMYPTNAIQVVGTTLREGRFRFRRHLVLHR